MLPTKVIVLIFLGLFSCYSGAQQSSPQFTVPTDISVNESAGTTASQQIMGQGMSVMQAASHYQQAESYRRSCCSGRDRYCCGPMRIQYGLAALSLKQANQDGATAAAANLTGFQSDGTGAYNSPDGNPYDPLGRLKNEPEFKKALSALKNFKNSGVYNEKTGEIKTLEGSNKISDFKSKQAMAAAGFSKSAIDSAMEQAKQISKVVAEKASNMKLGSLTTASGFDDGGGSGKSGLTPSSEETVSYSAVAAKPLPLDRDPSSLAGMQKNYHGEPIGVSADSIFLMMNRRYKVKESQDSFFNENDMSFQK